MEHLDRKIFNEMKEDIEDSVFADEFGCCIDSMAGLDTDEDIYNQYCQCDDETGGNENE